jgi:DnaJ-domain-containing protein 1
VDGSSHSGEDRRGSSGPRCVNRTSPRVPSRERAASPWSCPRARRRSEADLPVAALTAASRRAAHPVPRRATLVVSFRDSSLPRRLQRHPDQASSLPLVRVVERGAERSALPIARRLERRGPNRGGGQDPRGTRGGNAPPADRGALGGGMGPRPRGAAPVRRSRRAAAAVASPRSIDPHALLGVAPGAPLEEVKAAFRRKALEHHPDRGGEAAAFIAVKRAYDRIMRRRAVRRR